MGIAFLIYLNYENRIAIRENIPFSKPRIISKSNRRRVYFGNAQKPVSWIFGGVCRAQTL